MRAPKLSLPPSVPSGSIAILLNKHEKDGLYGVEASLKGIQMEFERK